MAILANHSQGQMLFMAISNRLLGSPRFLLAGARYHRNKHSRYCGRATHPPLCETGTPGRVIHTRSLIEPDREPPKEISFPFLQSWIHPVRLRGRADREW